MEAVKDLLYKIADDQLIIGHRNSEWTGIGPLLEEDIAFSSMAQDKIGQSLAIYNILHDLGEPEPDITAFLRRAEDFHNCTFVELPIGEYDFSLIRHFLFDNAEFIRFRMLTESSFQPIAFLAKKMLGELKYHVMHANTWIKQLGTANEESISRLQKSLDYAIPFALGMFEKSKYEKELIDQGIFEGEEKLKNDWMKQVMNVIDQTNLVLPDLMKVNPAYGGRYGSHTHHLQPLLDEMSEVIRQDPEAEW